MANPKGNPQNLKPFRPGNNANPGGKPVHARNSLSNAFLKALAKDFDEHGPEAITATRENHPDRYVAICASLVPKDDNLNVNMKRDARDYSDDELNAIIANAVSSRAGEAEQAAGEGEPSSVH